MSIDNATPTENGGEAGEQQSPVPSPQQLERDRIAQQYEQQLLNNGEIEAVDEPPETTPHQQPEPQLQQKQEQRFKVKVDGQEKEVGLDDLIRVYQKNDAADLRLQQATEMRQQVEAEKAALEQQKQTQQSSQSKKTDSPAIEDLLKQRREALEYADGEEFNRLDNEINQLRLKELSSQQQTIDPEQLISQATQRMQQQIEYNAAFNDFKTRNPQYVNDPVLHDLSMKAFNAYCAESQTYTEAFSKAEAAINQWLGSIAGNSGNAAPDSRTARKNAIPNNVGRVNAKTASPPAEQSEAEITAAYIAHQRKIRGLK